ncbi:uncharacterized protein LOC125505601 [Dendroctonus ponderosae]|uniref:uncharacterized protein LOC125505601 n=1 Tax=Dendroctonus ponderosae TaxID=77166 RepID=UPI002034B148|nr:uncharacterized protein LOC125505601 [Dendroctonus ponderosae]
MEVTEGLLPSRQSQELRCAVVVEQEQLNLGWIHQWALARLGPSESPITAAPHGTKEMWREAEVCREAKELIETPSGAKATIQMVDVKESLGPENSGWGHNKLLWFEQTHTPTRNW